MKYLFILVLGFCLYGCRSYKTKLAEQSATYMDLSSHYYRFAANTVFIDKQKADSLAMLAEHFRWLSDSLYAEYLKP